MSACLSKIGSCNSNGISIDCYFQIFRNTNLEIKLKLIDSKDNLIDMDEISYISIKLYDMRDIVLGIYEYSNVTYTTYSDELIDDVNIIQTKYSSTFSDEEQIFNKGEISFLITEQISNLLMIGNIYIDIKYIRDGVTTIINSFNIGTLIQNKF